eukprot:508308_1
MASSVPRPEGSDLRGWHCHGNRTRNNHRYFTCPDTTEPDTPTTTCFCPTEATWTTETTILTHPSYDSCDCEGGMIELRFTYTGAENDVEIDISEEGGDTICQFSGVYTGDMIL